MNYGSKDDDFQKTNLPSYKKSIVFTLLLIGLTLTVIFRESKISELIRGLRQVKTEYLLLGVGTMALFFFGQAVCTWLLLRSLGYPTGLGDCIRYTLIDFYFSSITPGCIGGQPSEIYFMKKDGIEVGTSSLVMLIFNGIYHLSALLVAGLSSLFFGKRIFSNPGIFSGFRLLFFFGLAAQLTLTLGFFTMVFSKRIAPSLWDRGIILGEKMKLVKDPDAMRERVARQLSEYRRGARYIRKNPKVLLAVLLIGVVHIILLYSVPYWIYRGMGLTGSSPVQIVAMQSMLTISFESLPIPGGLGLMECGFVRMYAMIFGRNHVVLAMLLARGISYHFSLIVGGMVTVFSKHRQAVNKESLRRGRVRKKSMSY